MVWRRTILFFVRAFCAIPIQAASLSIWRRPARLFNEMRMSYRMIVVATIIVPFGIEIDLAQ
jgi:hypothetical protein